MALDTIDGSVLWRAAQEAAIFEPTITEGTIVACDAGQSRAFDPATGDLRWEIDIVGRLTEQTAFERQFGWRHQFIPVVHDGRISIYLDEDRLLGVQ